VVNTILKPFNAEAKNKNTKGICYKQGDILSTTGNVRFLSKTRNTGRKFAHSCHLVFKCDRFSSRPCKLDKYVFSVILAMLGRISVVSVPLTHFEM